MPVTAVDFFEVAHSDVGYSTCISFGGFFDIKCITGMSFTELINIK